MACEFDYVIEFRYFTFRTCDDYLFNAYTFLNQTLSNFQRNKQDNYNLMRHEIELLFYNIVGLLFCEYYRTIQFQCKQIITPNRVKYTGNCTLPAAHAPPASIQSLSWKQHNGLTMLLSIVFYSAQCNDFSCMPSFKSNYPILKTLEQLKQIKEFSLWNNEK